ncbi:MAG: RNA polymerase subunit sigma-24, partial [Tabrizicola sp.]|nr:RNA polymerase subunit sigma-24 [Tabrizicola sp.]
MSADPIASLIAACATGDRRAFRALYHDAAAKLMGVLLRMLGERAEAEDALQEVFTRVWLRAGR